MCASANKIAIKGEHKVRRVRETRLLMPLECSSHCIYTPPTCMHVVVGRAFDDKARS